MNRDEVIAEILRHRPAFEAEGVTHVYLFGSVLRGEAGPASDVDLLFEHRLSKFGLFEYSHLKSVATDLIGGRVDFIERSCLDPAIRARVEAEALRVF